MTSLVDNKRRTTSNTNIQHQYNVESSYLSLHVLSQICSAIHRKKSPQGVYETHSTYLKIPQHLQALCLSQFSQLPEFCKLLRALVEVGLIDCQKFLYVIENPELENALNAKLYQCATQ